MSEHKSTTKSFTPGEMAIISECFRNMTGDPNIDFDTVAATLNYKDGGIARQRFRQIRSKYASEAPAGGVDKQSPTKNSPAKPRKAAAEKDGDGSTAEKPKRGRKPKASPKVRKEEEHEVKSEEDGGGAVKETGDGVDGGSADADIDVDEEAA